VLAGNIDPVALEAARERGVESLVEVRPYMPHGAAVRLMRSSALLLLLINRVDGAEGIMTGKLFEYVASGRPVLGIGPAAGDAAGVLRQTGAGEMLDYDDADGVAEILSEAYAAWKAGQPQKGAPPDAASPYSRRSQTGRLAALLNEMIAGKAE
jgi:hypothetical protein